ECVHSLMRTVDHVEHARWRAGVGQQLGQPRWTARVAFRGLEHEGVSAGDREREHPQGDHGWKVERCDTRTYAHGLAHGPGIDPSSNTAAELPLEQMRDTAGKLDNFDPTYQLRVCIREHFAVLRSNEACKLVRVPPQQIDELQ